VAAQPGKLHALDATKGPHLPSFGLPGLVRPVGLV
jgi:hypothetical protein